MVGVCNTDLAAARLTGQAEATMVTVMGRGMVSAGIRTPRSLCFQAGLGKGGPQAVMGRGALVWTLDGAWKKLRQVVPAKVGLQQASTHSSLEVGAPDK